MTGRDIFSKNKFIINAFVAITKVIPRFLRVFLWDLISPYSQIMFVGMRYVILKSLISECGDNVRIGNNVRIIHWENIKFGCNISIHPNCYIDGAGGIIIKDNVSIAHNSSILSSNHGWLDYSQPIKYNEIQLKSVFIDDDVWIGCGCRILAGVTLGSRTIIAAGAVVNKSFEGKSIYGGIPAKLIKEI